MATTTNYGWETPDDTDLVKDGASAMRTLGQSIDTTFAELKGGTSGQMLTKASNTDNDYTWVTPEIGDITAITASSPLTGGGTTGAVTVGILDGTTSNKGAVQLSTSTSSTSTSLAATASAVKSAYDLADGAIPKSLIDAAGDLIVGTAADTAGRLAKGTAGQVLQVNSGATALEWATPAGGSGMTLLASGSLGTSNSVTISTLSQSYKDLKIYLKDYKADQDFYVGFRVNSDGGTNYSYIYQYNSSSSAVSTTYANNQDYVYGYANEYNGTQYFTEIDLYDYTNTTTRKCFQMSQNGLIYDSSFKLTALMTGQYHPSTAAAVSSLSFKCNTGVNFTAGTYEIYGVK
jgi:hypothetical protein